ncbi:hypothetical protein [Cupriavidus lacunae]|uniref:hypothetical protein n=1 Tax=Cupriavidus lacunae TaxID=2666307 RepID=UPI001ABF8A1B|nr:hypothetical protein [Cupriavidus lacunae]
MTGNSQQSVDWIARKADGWITYPRRVDIQVELIRQWHASVEAVTEDYRALSPPFALLRHVHPSAAR